jgi:hypothetical protein
LHLPSTDSCTARSWLKPTKHSEEQQQRRQQRQQQQQRKKQTTNCTFYAYAVSDNCRQQWWPVVWQQQR